MPAQNKNALYQKDLRSNSQEIFTYELDKLEINTLLDIAQSLRVHFNSVESKEFADRVAVMSEFLPGSLRATLREFKIGILPGVVRLKGLGPLALDHITTPPHWDVSWERPDILELEIIQCLISSAVGEIFGWHTQENGRFLRHIVPVKDHAFEQLGAGSAVELEWHNEDAFHEHRADAMTIMCYRNHERAVTTICGIDDLSIPQELKQILFQKRFIILPDKSHTESLNQSIRWRVDPNYFEKIARRSNEPETVAVLLGSFERPFVRVDPAFMKAIDSEANAALSSLIEIIDRSIIEVALKPGELLLIDNYRAVHGRRRYRPMESGERRWLRRVNIAFDLRKSGTTTFTRNTRIIY